MLNTRTGENYNANDVINSNDLKKRIISVDSRFRSVTTDPTTDFTYKLEHAYKNVIRMRIASAEVPNMFYAFTKKNNCFTVKAFDITGIARTVTIVIKEGNYTSEELMAEIQEKLDTNIRNPFGIYMSISLDTINAKVTITNNGVSAYPVTSPNPFPTASAKPFILDFCSCSPVKNRPENWGLGYNLGYRRKQYKVTTKSLAPPIPPAPALEIYSQISESCIDVVTDTYMLLCINDLHTVEHRTTENYIQCLAKIIIREQKHMVVYDDGATLMANEVIFPSPTDVKILNVKLIDPYGDVIDLCGMNFSFSLEITEVLNTKLYDFYRNYIWLGTIPSVNYKTVQGAAQSLLKGIGPPW